MRKPQFGGAVYILPNLLTTGNLFWGFFSVIKALQGEFYLAAIAILLAAVFDMLDGRVARLTKGTSEFGVQYDSLCDLLSFGFAPAFLAYQYGLSDFNRLGWIFCFLYLACGALRLARFNVQSSIGKASGDFTGLPIPMAAVVIATYVAFVTELDKNGSGLWILDQLRTILGEPETRGVLLLVITPLLGLLMISNIQFRSHKVLKIGRIKPFTLLAILVFFVAVLAYQPEAVGFLLCILYALSGPFEWAIGWKKLTEDDDIFGPQEDDQSIMDSPSFQESGHNLHRIESSPQGDGKHKER